MTKIYQKEFSKKEGEKCINFARKALDKYTIEGQRLDVGSADEILTKRGGVFIQIESINGFGKLRGNGAIYDGRRISDAIIDSIIYAASSRSIGSEIHKSELDDLIIKLSLIEKVTITKNPEEILNIGEHCFVIPEGLGIWLYPMKACKHNWSPQEYISRTYRSSKINPLNWDSNVVVTKVSSFVEQNPSGITLVDNPN